EDGIRDFHVTGVQTCALPICAVQSPQLLELSGIGRPDVLAGAGIELRHALPSVGENYLDHFCTRMNWRVSLPETLNEETRGWRRSEERRVGKECRSGVRQWP